MAIQAKVKNPFKQVEEDAYYRIGAVGFDLINKQAIINNAVYRSQADRQAGKKPYPLEQKDSATIVAGADAEALIADTDIMAQALLAMAVLPEFSELTADATGYTKQYEDEYGETHPEAYWTPKIVQVEYDDEKPTVKMSYNIYASKAAYEAEAVPFTQVLQVEVGDVASFIAALDTAGGRAAMYAGQKSKNPKFAGAQDV